MYVQDLLAYYRRVLLGLVRWWQLVELEDRTHAESTRMSIFRGLHKCLWRSVRLPIACQDTARGVLPVDGRRHTFPLCVKKWMNQ